MAQILLKGHARATLATPFVFNYGNSGTQELSTQFHHRRTRTSIILWQTVICVLFSIGNPCACSLAHSRIIQEIQIRRLLDESIKYSLAYSYGLSKTCYLERSGISGTVERNSGIHDCDKDIQGSEKNLRCLHGSTKYNKAIQAAASAYH